MEEKTSWSSDYIEWLGAVIVFLLVKNALFPEQSFLIVGIFVLPVAFYAIHFLNNLNRKHQENHKKTV